MSTPGRRVFLAPLLLLGLAACGDSDDDGPATDDETAGAGAGTYLIGGAGCSAVSVSVTGPATPVPAGEGERPGVAAPVGAGAVDVGAGTGDTGTIAPDEPCAPSPTELPSSGLPSTGDGTLRFEGGEYALDSAILVFVRGEDGPAELVLHDGETRVARNARTSGDDTSSGYAYGVYDATAALSLTLFTADGIDGELSGRTYELVPDGGSDGAASGAAGTAEALLVVDVDGDGAVTSEAELVEPVSGRLVWGGTREAPSLSFDFVLEDGRSIEGSYEGGYELID